jgi:hypothetical protein
MRVLRHGLGLERVAVLIPGWELQLPVKLTLNDEFDGQLFRSVEVHRQQSDSSIVCILTW